MSNLPPGVTDSMIDDHVNGPMCECGHYAAEHYSEDNEIDFDPLRRNENDWWNAVTYNAKGERLYACDCYVNIRLKQQCSCEKFTEGEYEPDVYEYDD